MSESKVNKECQLGLDRIVFFSDAIIAIAITLLVIELKLPVITSGNINKELMKSLMEMWPEFLGYLVSFSVISNYWILHHKLFGIVINFNRKLIYLNTLFLMFIAFMPYATWLLFSYPAKTITVILYSGLILMINGSLSLIFKEVLKENLFNKSTSHNEIINIKSILLSSTIVFTLSILLAFKMPLTSTLTWTLFIPLSLIIKKRKKHDNLFTNLLK